MADDTLVVRNAVDDSVVEIHSLPIPPRPPDPREVRSVMVAPSPDLHDVGTALWIFGMGIIVGLGVAIARGSR